MLLALLMVCVFNTVLIVVFTRSWREQPPPDED